MVYHADQGTGAWADSEKIVDRPLSWAVYYLRGCYAEVQEARLEDALRYNIEYRLFMRKLDKMGPKPMVNLVPVWYVLVDWRRRASEPRPKIW